jgi:hypothetical protein
VLKKCRNKIFTFIAYLTKLFHKQHNVKYDVDSELHIGIDYGRSWWQCGTLRSASAYSVSGPIFGPLATRIRSKGANHWTAMSDK